jgi:hypothetical protein
MKDIAHTLGVLARLTGQFDVGSRILKLPQWKRIEKALEQALTPFPDAARAVATALQALESEFGQ